MGRGISTAHSASAVSRRPLDRGRLPCTAALLLLAVLVLPAYALPPIFITEPPLAATQNQPYFYRFRAIDLDFGDQVVYATPQLPAWLVFDGVDSIAGTPLAGDVGLQAVTITASDGTSTTTRSFEINVANVDDPPLLVAQITPDPQAVSELAVYDFSVAPFFTDPDGDALLFSASNLPPDLAINSATGVIGGQPRGPRRGDVPQYVVTITATNAGGSASDSFILIINNENDPPQIPEPVPPLHTREDEPIDVTPDALGAFDEDPDDTLTVILHPPAANANFTLEGNRVQPAANYSGTLELQAQARDTAGALSNLANVTVLVEPQNDAPRAKAIPPQAIDEGSAFSFDASQYFSDVENDRLAYEARGLPPGLAIDAGSGVISGTPPIGTEAGDFDAEIVAKDASASAVASLKATIVRARRADLVASASVAPNPSLLGNEATWTLAVKNDSTADVGNATLAVVFTGDAPLTFAAPSESSCTLQPGAAQTNLDCRFGPLAAGAEFSVTVASTASRAGAAHAVATAAILDSIPIEGNPGNDGASAALGFAERLSAGPAQRLTLQDGRAAAGGDLDGDGFVDLAIATAGGPAAFRNVADPGTPSKRMLADVPIRIADESANGNGIAIADLDGDGDSDVVTANAAGEANKALINDGGGAFTAVAIAATDAASRAVAVGDVDGDARMDIAFANQGPSGVHVNRGANEFALAQTVGDGDSRDVLLVNLLGDSLPEVVLANGAGDAAVYRNSAGTLTHELDVPTGPTMAAAAADFDGDGDLDLVFGRTGNATAPPAAVVFLNTSGAAGAFFKSADLLGAALDVLAADVDQDGDADIAAFGADGGHRLYVNDGAARFALHAEHFVHAGAQSAATGQFSLDDRVDIAVAGSTAIGVFLNDGKGNFGSGDSAAPTVSLRGEPTVSLTVGEPYQDPGATATDDIDGDLTAAIVVKNPVDTAVVGTYSVTYDVSDHSGNPASTVTRTVEVKPQTGTGGGGGGALGIELALLLGALARLRRNLFFGSTKMQIRTQSMMCGALLALAGAAGEASDLSYTFIDFEVLNQDIGVSGVLVPVPGQSVAVRTNDGDGISVAGGVALPRRFYLTGRFRSSVADVDATITSPLTVVQATDEFDVVTSELAVGYQRELAENFDVIAEIARETADFDFGSFVGENFDTKDSGVGARVGFRWNPQPALEVFASARFSPVGKPILSERRFDRDTLIATGVRWYFFEDLGLALDYESGEVSTLTLAMRFSFGNLAW